MTKEIECRAASSKDAKEMMTVQFKAVQSISKKNYAKQVLSAWSPKPNSQRIQWFASFINNDNVRCYVATNKKSKVLGVAVYLISEQCVKSLYVDPKHSGNGIGTRLLKRIERYANRKSADKLHLKASTNSKHSSMVRCDKLKLFCFLSQGHFSLKSSMMSRRRINASEACFLSVVIVVFFFNNTD